MPHPLLAFTAAILMLAGLAPMASADEPVMPKILTEGEPYLPDWSYAGYRWGEQPLPDSPGQVIDVTAYGVTADDDTDDTEAMRAALKAAHEVDGPVVVRLPAGRVIVSEILWLERSNLVLQGAGSGEGGTELHIPRPMDQMQVPERIQRFKEARGQQSAFSWLGGVIWSRRPADWEDAAPTTASDGRRGEHTFKVEDPTAVKQGMTVSLEWRNPHGEDSPMLAHVLGSENVRNIGSHLQNPDMLLVRQDVYVEHVSGDTVTIKEPLLHDVRAEWTRVLERPLLSEVGVEHLRITFPHEAYRGHMHEAGYNAIYLTQVGHGWVRDVTVDNVDSGIVVANSHHVTLTDITVLGRYTHYGVMFSSSYALLCRDFDSRAPSRHTISFGTRAVGCVFTHGLIEHTVVKRPHGAFDQHAGVNHQNLLDNLEIRTTNTSQLLSTGGSREWKPAAGGYNTFWNLYIDTSRQVRDRGLRHVRDAPQARWVGLRGDQSIRLNNYGPDAYIEALNQPIAVPSLYEYQLQQRLSAP